MNAFLILLDPSANLSRPEALEADNIKEFDFIQAFTGHANLTHAWNQFALRTEVVARLIS